MAKVSYLPWFLLALLGAAVQPVGAIQILGSTTFGGAGDQAGLGIVADGSGVWASGMGATSVDSSEGVSSEGIVAGFLGGNNPASGGPPTWRHDFPGVALWDYFRGIAQHGSSVFPVGASYSQTSDGVGGKEGKGIATRYAKDGTPGAAAGGSEWVTQIPGPGYSGVEDAKDVTVAVEGGTPYLYVTGFTQSSGSTAILRVSKVDTNGNIVWSVADPTSPNNFDIGAAVEKVGNEVWVFGQQDQIHMNCCSARPVLARFDESGAHLGTTLGSGSSDGRTFQGATTGSVTFAVGQTSYTATPSDYLVARFNSDGTINYEATYDAGGADFLYDALWYSDRLFAVGKTSNGSFGGMDSVLLELDPDNGSVLDSLLWGGSGDDDFQALAVDTTSDTLYAIGKRYNGTDDDIAIVGFSISEGVPEPATLALLGLGLAGLGFRAGRRRG